MKVRSKAIRSGAWYEALTRTERAIVDLTTKCVETVKSPTLAKAITKILNKIVKTLEKTFVEKAEEIGNGLAISVSSIATKWGHKSAPHWKNDKRFIRFLGITILNT